MALLKTGGPRASGVAPSPNEAGRAEHGSVFGVPRGGVEHEGRRVEARESVGYLISWFSVYGAAVGLKLPRSLWP
jgi:hypothetical protein